MMPLPESTPHARSLVYGLLITLAVGVTLGRIASAERLNEPSVHRGEKEDRPRPPWPSKRPDPWPTFSSNDRSRFALARALVEEGTWVVGRRDRVVVTASAPALLAATHPLELIALGQAGLTARTSADSGIIFQDGFQSVDKVLNPTTLEYYSTKPPLLSVLVAGEYWLLKQLFGWDMVRDRFLVVRTILLITNVLPLLLYLWLLSRMADELGQTDWARYFVVGAAGFATLVTPFLISLNNHTVATTAATVALYATARALRSGGGSWYFLAGLAAGFTACNDLPALALAGMLGLGLLFRAPGRALFYYLPGVLLLCGTQMALEYAQSGQLLPTYFKFGTPWYEYEGSHWRVPEGIHKRGIDFAGRNGEPREVYAFHLLLGHHGWFSLMPLMLLSVPGMFVWLTRGTGGERGEFAPPARSLAVCSLVVSLVVIGFYLYRSDNYGGWSNGPRWLMWLTPLWLLSLLPILDLLEGNRWGRLFALLLLVMSILSMTYQYWNPWRHPWIYNWLESTGHINY